MSKLASTKNKPAERYCFLEPDFPKEAFMVGLFFTSKTTPLMITPLSTVSENIDGVLESVIEFVNGVNKANKKKAEESIEIIDTGVLIPITFQKLFPLKKEHWTKAVINPDFKDKVFVFLPAMDKPQFYKLLVVPYGHIKKKWEFCAAYPFSIFSDDTEIEKFMFGSKQVVDISAKYAAIYNFGEPKRLNWKTGEVSTVIRTNQNPPKLTN